MIDSGFDEQKPRVIVKESRTFGFPQEFHHLEIVDGETFDLNFRLIFPATEKQYFWDTEDLADSIDVGFDHNTLNRQGLKVPPYVCGIMTNIQGVGPMTRADFTLSFVDDHEILLGAMVADGMSISRVRDIANGLTIPGYIKSKSAFWIDLGKEHTGYSIFGENQTGRKPHGYVERIRPLVRAVDSVLIHDMNSIIGGERYSSGEGFEIRLTDQSTREHKAPHLFT